MYSLADINQLIVDSLDTHDAQIVLDTLTTQLERDKVPPMPTEGKTWGDWAFTVPYLKEELRPFSALSYQNIELMLRTGIIRFAVDLKRAKMVSPFRNERSLQVISPDKELSKAGLASLTPLLPQLMFELSWSSLIYGSAFIETIWGTKTGYELGIDERRTSELWSVPTGFNLVPHKTVRAIKRLENGQFDGFIQNPTLAANYYPVDNRTAGLLTSMSPNEVVVSADSALVVPYNGYSRKLWGESFLGPIYPLWFWYEIIMRCLVSYTQLMGDPPRLGKAPSKKKLEVSTTKQVIDAVDYIMAVGVNLSKSNTAVIPSDVDPETKTPLYDLAYMTVPERSQPFVQILEHINQQILRAALSSDKTLISSPGGGGAIGEIHAEATALHDEMIVSSWLYYINNYFVKYLSVFNRGRQGPPIRLEIQGLDPREQQLLQSVMGVAGNTKSFDDFFYSVDWRSLGNLAGLPMLTDEQKAELKQKLQEEGLQNQMAQQEVAAQGETGFLPKNGEQKKLEAKIDELLARPPIALSMDEVTKLKPIIEEPPKVYQINAPFNKKKQVAAVVASLLLEGGNDDDNPFSSGATSIQLFNPYHDALGRFASRAGGAIKSGAKKAGKVGKEFWEDNKAEIITGAVIGAGVGAGIYGNAQFKKGLPEAKEYREKFYELTPTHKKIVAAPAEYLARKHSYGALIARSALGAGGLTTSTVSDSLAERVIGTVLPYGLGPSTFLSLAMGGTIYAKGALLGTAAATAIGAAVFGSSMPAIIPIAGGILVGTTASVLAYQMVDYAGRKFTQAYLNRFAPKDDHHITITNDGVISSWSEYSQLTGASIAFYGIWNIGKAGLLGLEEGEHPHLMASMVPLVSLLVLYKGINEIVSDIYVPGFEERDGKWVLTKETADNFINLWTGEEVRLFNPYHDEMGRFAPKAALLFGSGGSRISYSPGKVAQNVDRVKKDYGPLTDFKVVSCADMTCVKKSTGSSNPNILGAFSDGKLVLSPNIGSLMDRVVTHEAIHARRRSKGGAIALRSNVHRQVEEGCTELMTFRKVKDNWRSTPYNKEILTVASAARNFSGGDAKKAWKFIKDVHYYNDTDIGVSAVNRFKRGQNPADVEWLLSNRNVTLEETDERLRLSEEAIYQDIRKVGNEKVNLNVDLPEEFYD